MLSYSGNTFTRNWMVDEKAEPDHRHALRWVRARVLGGKTNLWGRVSLRMSDFDFKAASRDGFGDDWPISYADISPYYDKVDRLLGISGTKENLPQLPDSLFQRALKLNCGEMILKKAIAKMGRHLIPGPGRRHDRGRGEQVPQPLHGARPLRPRLQSARADALADRADLSGARHRQPHGPAQFDGVGSAARPEARNKASGVRVIDSATQGGLRLHARASSSSPPRRSRSTRLLLHLEVARTAPNGLANSSGVVGHYFCEHIMGRARAA